jgi:flagellar hook assembly protein FlgD
MGNKITEINETNLNPGYKTTPIYWDGTNSSGSKLPLGMYIYRVQIITPDGKKTNKSSKLMIFK